MYALLNLAGNVILLLIWILILAVLFSIMRNFNFITTENRLLFNLGLTFERLADYFLAPLRRIIPLINGIDITPAVAILLLLFLRDILFQWRFAD